MVLSEVVRRYVFDQLSRVLLGERPRTYSDVLGQNHELVLTTLHTYICGTAWTFRPQSEHKKNCKIRPRSKYKKCRYNKDKTFPKVARSRMAYKSNGSRKRDGEMPCAIVGEIREDVSAKFKRRAVRCTQRKFKKTFRKLRISSIL
jgi:hypothetical protein